jgi:hypothetical protein
MRDNNILCRHIKPAARRLKLDRVNWQVLRRSCATWLQPAGVDVKDAQEIVRHSRTSTTQDVYRQIAPESRAILRSGDDSRHMPRRRGLCSEKRGKAVHSWLQMNSKCNQTATTKEKHGL